MKDQWYGDNRDLVKWGVLLQLARLYGASRIVQVAYYRPEAKPEIEIDGTPYPMPEAVISHFPRDVMDIMRLNSPQAKIEVVNSPFLRREPYMRDVQDALAKLDSSESPCIIFLDPDTGLEPNNPDLKHVLKSELAQIWNAMRGNDVLVLYQHKTHEKNWIEPKQKQFESALGLSNGTAKMAQSKPATDVVFFFAQKRLIGSAQKT
ncbi:MAG TPA: hypothetical protein VMT20_19610 [Terriglobia bacterium]|nr:hypothetical protein [Terriglobia bacterium]